jgi:hypothetical protein
MQAPGGGERPAPPPPAPGPAAAARSSPAKPSTTTAKRPAPASDDSPSPKRPANLAHHHQQLLNNAAAAAAASFTPPAQTKHQTADPDPRPNNYRPWTAEEDDCLRRQVALHGAQSWSKIAKALDARNGKSCRLRWGLQLWPWCWEIALSVRAVAVSKRDRHSTAPNPLAPPSPLPRRWVNQLAPNLKQASFTPEEDEILLEVRATGEEQTALGCNWF